MDSQIAKRIEKTTGRTGRFDEIDMMFISEQLDLHGEFLSDLFVKRIDNKKLRDSDELIDNITYKVQKYGNSPVLAFRFPDHGRFIEINFHKKKGPRSIAEAIDTDQLLYNIQRRKKAQKKKKDTRWYTHNVYGSLNRLLERLASEYSEVEIARLKGILKLSAQNSSSVSVHI